MMKKELLIVYKGPFGTLVDAYKWCQYLKDDYHIKYVQLNGDGEVSMNGISKIRVPNRGHRIIRGILFMLVCLFHIAIAKGPIIIVYFDGCGFFKKVLPWKKMILDIRTLSVDKDPGKRRDSDSQLKHTCLLYDHINIIQEDLIEKIGLDKAKFSIVPLGADVLSHSNKNFDSLKLLYVGTLEGRHISETLYGLSHYLKLHPNESISYDIIGDGITDKKENLIKIAELLGLHKVKVWGRKPYHELESFFDSCNVGVSFVPQTEWYDHQPPTKTFEYILSGLYCMATSTSENKKIVTEKNGVLHEDNAISFAEALEKVQFIADKLDSEEIRNTIKGYTWSEIVKNYLLPVLRRFE